MTPAPDALEVPSEVRLDLASIELLAARVADLLAERLGPPPPASTRPDRISAAEVAEWWGVGRGWVYQHAAELGAIRIGDGERPRLRFDPEQVAKRLDRPPSTPQPAAVEPRPRGRRSPRIHRDHPALAFRPEPELSSLNKDNKMAGRRANAPGRGAEEHAFGTTSSLPLPRPGVDRPGSRPSPELHRHRHRR